MSDPHVYEYKGHKFLYDEDAVWAESGELHPQYVVYACLSIRGVKNPALREVKIINGIETILRRKEQWIEECDERGGLPPGPSKKEQT